MKESRYYSLCRDSSSFEKARDYLGEEQKNVHSFSILLIEGKIIINGELCQRNEIILWEVPLIRIYRQHSSYSDPFKVDIVIEFAWKILNKIPHFIVPESWLDERLLPLKKRVKINIYYGYIFEFIGVFGRWESRSVIEIFKSGRSTWSSYGSRVVYIHRLQHYDLLVLDSGIDRNFISLNTSRAVGYRSYSYFIVDKNGDVFEDFIYNQIELLNRSFIIPSNELNLLKRPIIDGSVIWVLDRFHQVLVRGDFASPPEKDWILFNLKREEFGKFKVLDLIMARGNRILCIVKYKRVPYFAFIIATAKNIQKIEILCRNYLTYPYESLRAIDLGGDTFALGTSRVFFVGKLWKVPSGEFLATIFNKVCQGLFSIEFPLELTELIIWWIRRISLPRV